MTTLKFFKTPADYIIFDASFFVNYNVFCEFISANEIFVTADNVYGVLKNNIKVPISSTTFMAFIIQINQSSSIISIYQILKVSLYVIPLKSTNSILEIVNQNDIPQNVNYNTINGFDENFINTCIECLKIYAKNVYAKKSPSKSKALSINEFKLHVYDIENSKSLSLSYNNFYKSNGKALIFEKNAAYSFIEFNDIKEVICAKFEMDYIINNPHINFTFYNSNNELQYDHEFSKFNITFITRYICLYLSFFQYGLDLVDEKWNCEANRRMIINIFVIMISSMSSKNFSVEHNIKYSSAKRIGNGPLDYLFLPSYLRNSSPLLLQNGFSIDPAKVITANDLFTTEDETFDSIMKQFMTRDIRKQHEMPVTSSSLTTTTNTASIMPSTASNINTNANDTTNTINLLHDNNSMFVVTMPIDGDDGGEEDDAGVGTKVNDSYENDECSHRPSFFGLDNDVTLLEGKKDNQFVKENLEKSLGQLAAQMLDCFNFCNEKRKTTAANDMGMIKEVGKKRRQMNSTIVKGMICTGQSCLYFAMQKGYDTEGNEESKPSMHYYGCSRVNILPSLPGRLSGIHCRTLSITPKEVEIFLKELYIFMNIDLDAATKRLKQ